MLASPRWMVCRLHACVLQSLSILERPWLAEKPAHVQSRHNTANLMQSWSSSSWLYATINQNPRSHRWRCKCSNLAFCCMTVSMSLLYQEYYRLSGFWRMLVPTGWFVAGSSTHTFRRTSRDQVGNLSMIMRSCWAFSWAIGKCSRLENLPVGVLSLVITRRWTQVV